MAEPDNSGKKSLDDLNEKASKELVRIHTVFPFATFPTEVVVDELKVTIITRWFMYKEYLPILIKDIKTVTVSHNGLFAVLSIEINGLESNPTTVGHLHKDQAVKAHQVIMGLIAVHKEKADQDMKDLSEKNLVNKLMNIGGTGQEPEFKDAKIKSKPAK